MDDPSELINKFCTEADAAREELRSTQEVSVDAVTLQSVLTERLGLSNSVFLIDQNLDKKRILEVIAGHNFKSLVATVEMDCDILPNSVLRLVTEAEVTVKNQIWRIHKGDADYFPSDPHAHNVETNIKLDLGNGWTYRKRKCMGKVKRKFLVELRSKVEKNLRNQGIELPLLADE